MTLGKRILERRKRKKYKQIEVAGRAGISQAHLSRIERDIAIPDWTVVARLERVLGVRHGSLTRGLPPVAV